MHPTGRGISPAAVALGDGAVILLFAAIGRSSHGERGSVLLGTLSVALPFLVGWYAAALGLGAYRPAVMSRLRTLISSTVRAALTGGVVALIIRSILEERIVPASFVVVALSFLLVFLVGWRVVLYLAFCRLSGDD